MNARFLAIALSLFTVTASAQTSTIPQVPLANPSVVIVNQKIDLNHADSSTLIGSIKGIGKKRAEAIVAYRESHQGFKSIEELAEVKGLGQHFLNTHREKINEVFVIN